MQMAAKFKWDDIAEVLLDHKFYLTALELHTELLEHGKENKTLKDFFSNPGNFVSATPHSLAPPGVSTDLCKCMTFPHIPLMSFIETIVMLSARPSLELRRRIAISA